MSWCTRFPWALLLIVGCTPCADVDLWIPETYHDAPQIASEIDPTNSDANLIAWWEQFNDPILTSMVVKALCCNYDLRIARERVFQARAIVKGTASPLFPQIDAAASVASFRNSQTLTSVFITGFAPGGGAALDIGDTINNLFQVGFDATWELDFFGKRTDAAKGALWDAVATAETVRDVHVTVAAEVATLYMKLRSDQAAIKTIQDRVASDSELLRLLKDRFRAGYSSEIDVVTIEGLLDQRTGLQIEIEEDLYATAFAIATLLGQTPETIIAIAEERKDLPKATPIIPLGIPSDLLYRRGDVRTAESTMIASGARVSSARKELLPTILLAGMYGYASSFSGLLFHGASKNWNAGANFTQPIFHGGAIWANIEAVTSQQRQSVLLYEQTILGALQDIDTAVSNYFREKKKNQALQDSVKDYKRAMELAEKLYFAGKVDFLYILNLDIQLFLAQLNLIESNNLQATFLVSVYKALGGGWECGV